MKYGQIPQSQSQRNIKTKDIVSILKACRKLKWLNEINLVENWTDDELKILKDEEITKIVNELKLNVNLTILKLTSSELIDEEFKEIEAELKINKDNLAKRNSIRDSEESLSIEVQINEIKLCLGYSIQLILDDSWINLENMRKLEHYLMHEDHRISILNIEKICIKNVPEFYKLLSNPKINLK